MRIRFKNIKTFMAAYMADVERWGEYDVSPGYAADVLHISRQRVQQLIDSPMLDAVSTDDGYILLSTAQVLERKRKMALLTKSRPRAKLCA